MLDLDSCESGLVDEIVGVFGFAFESFFICQRHLPSFMRQFMKPWMAGLVM